MPPIDVFDFAGLKSYPPRGLRVEVADKERLVLSRDGPYSHIHYCIVKRKDGEFYFYRRNMHLGILDITIDRDLVMHGTLYGCLRALGYSTEKA